MRGRERAWIELSAAALEHNVRVLQSLLPPDCALMPAVKANAYGHGAALVAKKLQRLGIRQFCVASAEEGAALRRARLRGEILVLGYTHPEQFSLLRRCRLTQTVVDLEYARRLNAFGKKLPVHLKIDTGMHRLGERADHSAKIREIFAQENLTVTGIYTHLCADESRSAEDMNSTRAQADSFFALVRELEEAGFCCGRAHLLASYGLLNYPELGGSLARTGIALYGVLSRREDLAQCPVELQPVLSLKARVAQVKELYRGEAAGYGHAYVAEGDRRIAVLTIGYADGLPRELSCGRGSVLINGRTAPIAGRICMDQTIVDVTGIPGVRAGNTAVIIGKDHELEQTAYDLAEACGTITNELLSRLGQRLTRLMI